MGPEDPSVGRRLAEGLVATLGWDKIVSKTPNDVLIAALDALAANIALVAAASKGEAPKGEPPKGEGPKLTSPPPDDAAWGDAKKDVPTGAPGKGLDDGATVNLKGDELPPIPAPAPASAAGEEDVVIVDDDMDAAEERTATGAREEPSTSPLLVAAVPVPFPEEEASQKGAKAKRPEPAAPPAPRGRESHRPR